VPKPKNKTFDFGAIREASAALGEKDRSSEARQEAERGERVLVSIDSISRRPLDTRSIHEQHAVSLADSIGALGLLEPVVVDRRLRLLAGGHRLRALQLLQEQQPDVYAQWFATGVPVRMMDFDAEEDPDQALAVEVAENEQRRDYTREEVRNLAERLRALGYRDSVGRPKKGEKALAPALSAIVRKNIRTVERLLSDASAPSEAPSGELRAMQGVLRALARHRKGLPEDLRGAADDLVQKIGKRMSQAP
jgi:ParB family chromosome partitioning protein